MDIQRGDITWLVKPSAQGSVSEYRQRVGQHYRGLLRSFQDSICFYINSHGECTAKGVNISPMGGTPNGAKIFKMRWMYPGCGKSGGLRLAVLMWCNERKVVVAGLWERREDPSPNEFARTLADD